MISKVNYVFLNRIKVTHGSNVPGSLFVAGSLSTFVIILAFLRFNNNDKREHLYYDVK